MVRTITLALGIGLAAVPTAAAAQEGASSAGGGAGGPRTHALRVYLDCPRWFCDFDFLRRNIQFVDYVRDRHDAEVHILVTRQPTGGGGSAYTLNLIGRESFEGKADTLRYDAPRGSTEDERRRGLTHVIRLGLVRYAAHSPLADAIRVAFDGDQAAGARPAEPADDPWDYWVFDIGLSGSLDGQSSESASEFDVRFSTDRTTPEWKLDLGVRFGYDEDHIELEDQIIHSTEHTYYLGGSAVRSVGSNLALGLQAALRRPPARENRDRALRIAPAVEYSIFPYEQSDRRRLLVDYSAGTSDVRYSEETIFFKTRETLYDHRLALSYSARQPWGSAGVRLSGSQYLSYPDRFRASLGANINLQLTRGLSLDLNGRFEHVDDQIGLPAGEVSLEEVLLRRRQLETEYEYEMRIGFSYSFGSIFNNVVNPRFDDWN